MKRFLKTVLVPVARLATSCATAALPALVAVELSRGVDLRGAFGLPGDGAPRRMATG